MHRERHSEANRLHPLCADTYRDPHAADIPIRSDDIGEDEVKTAPRQHPETETQTYALRVRLESLRAIRKGGK